MINLVPCNIYSLFLQYKNKVIHRFNHYSPIKKPKIMNEQKKKMYAMVAVTIEGLGAIITKSEDFNPLEASLDTLNEMKDVLKHADGVIDQLVLRQVYNTLKEEK